MKRVYLTAVLIYLGSGLGQAQSRKQKPELFTSNFNLAKTSIFKTRIPTNVCTAIIRQAEEIVRSPDAFESLDEHDLLIASENLRACATTPALARFDRDLAVGLYGETVAERDRRMRGKM